MSEFENNPYGVTPNPTGDTPALEEHKHTIAITAVVITTLLAGVFFYNYASNNWFGGEELEQPLAVQPINSIACNYTTDDDAYNDAMNKKDLNTCSCIKGADQKNTCETTLKDVMTYDNAIKQVDASLCEELSTQDIKDACKNVVSSKVAYFEAQNPKQLATIYSNTHNENAIEQYEKVLESEPENVSMLINLALAYAEKGLKEQEQGRSQTPYVEKALATIEKAKALDEKNSEVHRVLGYIYEIKPDYRMALTMYEKAIELDANNILAYAGKGHTDRMMGMLELAVDDFKKAAELDTQKAYSFIYVNLCNLENSRGNSAEAEAYCKIVVDIKDADVVFKSEALQILSSIARDKKEYARANSYLLEARTLTPNDPNVYINLSKLNIYEEKYQEAESNARKAIELSPTKAYGQLALAQALYTESKFQESIQEAEKGLELVESDVSLLAPSKSSVNKSLYGIISLSYKQLGDVENQEKYQKLAEEALTSN